MKKLLLMLVLLIVFGCEEAQRNEVLPEDAIPLNQHLTSTPQDFKDAYGDTIETQIVYNLALLRVGQIEIAKTMMALDKKYEGMTGDPNTSFDN